MQAYSWHRKLFHFHLSKCGKEGEKLQKLEYLNNKKSSLDEIKSIFNSFSRLRFSKFKKVVSRSVFGEGQLTQILIFKNFCYLKIIGLRRRGEGWGWNCVRLFSIYASFLNFFLVFSCKKTLLNITHDEKGIS